MDFIKNYFLLFLKGMGMGAADVVPGVSGGTIAFITGIYEELLSTIAGINLGLLKTLRKEGFKAAWKQANGNFLLVLLAGIAVSVVSLAKLFNVLLHDHPLPLWGFFFGLILASIFYMGKQVSEWNAKTTIALIIGTAVVVGISMMPAMGNSDNYAYLFFCGMIAICAMILPGISGSFILLILGAYSTVLSAIDDRNIVLLAVFAAGCAIGLLAFSRALKWVFENYKVITLALLTGFLLGSLYKVWPWKTTQVVSVKVEHQVSTIEFNQFSDSYASLTALQQHEDFGKEVKITPIEESNVLPSQYSELNQGEDNQLMMVLLFAALGFSLIFVMERLAPKKSA